jgi:hypothetical protein
MKDDPSGYASSRREAHILATSFFCPGEESHTGPHNHTNVFNGPVKGSGRAVDEVFRSPAYPRAPLVAPAHERGGTRGGGEVVGDLIE